MKIQLVDLASVPRVCHTKLSKRRKCMCLGGIAIAIFFVIYIKTIIHVGKEFYTNTNFNIELCSHFHSFSGQIKHEQIPKIVHQIYFDEFDDTMDILEKFRPYQHTWIQKNPDHRYILWNASMIDELLNQSYPHVLPLYDRYRNHWSMREDIAKYVIIHHMGGVYADMDIMCKNSMNALYSQIGDKSVVLNYTMNPVGISNDFFMAARHHEFMAHVIDGLEEADVFYLFPYINTKFRTGRMFMLGRYLNYPHKEDDIYLIPQPSIYIVSTRNGQSWYHVDGQFIAIVWNGVNPIQILSMVLLVVFIVRINKLIRVRRELPKHSKPSRKRRVRFKLKQHQAIPEDEVLTTNETFSSNV